MGPKIGYVKPGGDSTLQPGREQLGFPGGSDGKEPACNAGDLGLILGLGRSPGGGNGNPLQYSCLENPMDRGAKRTKTQFIVAREKGHTQRSAWAPHE